MDDYLPINAVKLLHRRQIGLPLKEKNTAVRLKRNNYRCDFEILKTLLCDRQSYLEVLACRKVSRSAEPSFCHGRLFTCNYHSWFNLCTSPTSGPRLMKTNIFSQEPTKMNRRQNPVSDGIKVVDAVTLNPPNACGPLPNNEHLQCILLLTKCGWLYQFCLEDASLINKVYIATNTFADKLSKGYVEDQDAASLDTEDKTPGCRYNSSDAQRIEGLNFRYQYLNMNGEEEKVLVRSAAITHDGLVHVAYALYALFPLRLLEHFVTISTTNSVKAELWNDIFVLTSTKGSNVSLYSFKDIKRLHRIPSSHVKLKSILNCRDLLGNQFSVQVGSSEVGFPYTMAPLDLNTSNEWSHLQLFQTKAERHIFRVGGVPYHYAVPVNKQCTSWSLRNLADSKELSKFHVDEKWDDSHVSGFDFHSDDSGRIVLINKETITVYMLKQEIPKSYAKFDPWNVSMTRINDSPPKQKNYSTKTNSKKRRSDTNLSSHQNSNFQKDLITSYPISKTNSQLRVIGSACMSVPRRDSRPKVRLSTCFKIDISHCNKKRKKEIDVAKCNEDTSFNWIYPSSSSSGPVNRSSSGRLLRKTQRFDMASLRESEMGVLGVSYEDEMDLLAVLHYQANQDSFDSSPYDIVVSIFDNFDGAKLNTFVVERDVTPDEGNQVSVIIDEDTIIYTRTDMNNVLDYKILRLCRKC